MAYDGTAPADGYEDLTGKQIGTLKITKKRSTTPLRWYAHCTECNGFQVQTDAALKKPVAPSCKHLGCPTNAELKARVDKERAEKKLADERAQNDRIQVRAQKKAERVKAFQARMDDFDRSIERYATDPAHREELDRQSADEERAAREDAEKKAELQKQEAIVQSGNRSYVKVGEALKVILEKKLYKLKYRSFNTYCERRWGFKRSTAHDYLHAVEVLESVRTSVQIPLSKAVVLYRLDDAKQRQEIVDREDFKTMTVREVIVEVEERLPKPEPTAEPTPEQRVIHLVTAAKKEFSGAVSKMKELPANSAEYASLIAELEAALADLRKLKTEQLGPVVVESQDELKPVQTQAA